MRRILVMGPPGSGKSTVARRLGAQHGLPIFHLDQAFWQPGWIETPADDFRAEVERIAALPAWVIDGNYTGSTLEPRFRTADTIVYLDVPSWLCVLRILWRTASSYGRVRADSAPGCPERLDWASCDTLGSGTASAAGATWRSSGHFPAGRSCCDRRRQGASWRGARGGRYKPPRQDAV